MVVPMTFEKIAPPPPGAPEHPARRAARMIRDMHVETIQKIDAGQIWTKTVDGVTTDKTAEIRAECAAQVERCDELIKRADSADSESWSPPEFVLNNILSETQTSVEAAASIKAKQSDV